MTDDVVHVLVAALTGGWLVSGVLALCHQRVAAAILNVLCAAPVAVITLIPFARVAFDSAAYIRQYGQAAMRDFGFTFICFVLSGLAIAGSLVSLRGKNWAFVVGWLAMLPVVVALLYLAFWFKIF